MARLFFSPRVFEISDRAPAQGVEFGVSRPQNERLLLAGNLKR